MTTEPDESEEMDECANCGGQFFPCDLIDGEYCDDCNEEIHGED